MLLLATLYSSSPVDYKEADPSSSVQKRCPLKVYAKHFRRANSSKELPKTASTKQKSDNIANDSAQYTIRTFHVP